MAVCHTLQHYCDSNKGNASVPAERLCLLSICKRLAVCSNYMSGLIIGIQKTICSIRDGHIYECQCHRRVFCRLPPGWLFFEITRRLLKRFQGLVGHETKRTAERTCTHTAEIKQKKNTSAKAIHPDFKHHQINGA